MSDLDVLLDLPPDTLRLMTARQGRIYRFITWFIDQHGFSPSMREIAEHLGLSLGSTVHGDVCRLEELELIRRTPDRARTITLVELEAT